MNEHNLSPYLTLIIMIVALVISNVEAVKLWLQISVLVVSLAVGLITLLIRIYEYRNRKRNNKS